MPIVWREQMSVGVASIDEDHKRLIGVINQFEDLATAKSDIHGKDEAAMRALLGSLAAYARDHFSREERIQQEAGYDGLAENKAEHAKLTESLARMIRRFQQPSPEQGAVTPDEMVQFLQNWLVNHVIKCDLKMRGHKFPKTHW